MPDTARGYHRPGEFNAILHDFDDSDAARARNARYVRTAFIAALVLVLISALLGTAARPGASEVDDAPPLQDSFHRDDVYHRDPELPSESSLTAPGDVDDAVGLTPLGRNLSDSIPALCPNWPAAFTSEFRERCQYWLSEFAAWELYAKPGAGPATYVCNDESRCHGLGDRMGGVIGALNVAIHEKRPFRMAWAGVSQFFEPCLLRSVAANWAHSGKPPTRGCRADYTQTCSVFGVTCASNNAPRIYENLDRACLQPKACKRLREHHPDTLNVADVFGCPMRALAEPRAQFLDTKIPLRLNGKVVELTVKEAAREMENYHVISIHFRLGDKFAFFGNHDHPTGERYNFLRPFRCAMTLQSYLEGRPLSQAPPVVTANVTGSEWRKQDDAVLVNGKPVRWFLASDSTMMRQFALRLYGAKLILVDANPRHIAYTHARNSLLLQTFAEWYLLGLGQDMVANRIGMQSGKGDYYSGRISSFWKTTWTYQLKHTYYDAEHCRYREMPMDGTWHLASAECRSAATSHLQQPQPHLAYLDTLAFNTTFPRAWVDRGNILIMPAA